MRIAYCGNFGHPFCTEVHVSKSLAAMGHEVVQLQENSVNWPGLPKLLRQRRCEAMMWTRTWAVPRDEALRALDNLRAAGIPTVSYHLDRWWGLEREAQVMEYPFFRTDVVYSPDDQAEKWAGAGVTHKWLPPGVYAGETDPVEPDHGRFPHDVIFVGSHPYPHPDWEPVRSAAIKALATYYGNRFHVWPGRDGQGRPLRAVRNRDLQVLYASAKVVVGDSCLVGNPVRYWSDRIPETLGRGGALIHPEVPGLQDWYRRGEELLTYEAGNPDSLIEMAELALTDGDLRHDLQKAGREVVLGRDTYRHRMEVVVADIERLRDELAPASAAVGGGATGTAAPPAGGQVAARHRASRTRATFELAQGDTDRTAVREVWEDDTYQLTRDQVQGAVLDVGANVGAFSVLAAKMGATAVHAYEPHAGNRNALVENLARNAVRTIVLVRPEAVLGEDSLAVPFTGDGGGAHVTLDPDNDLVLVAARGINEVLADELEWSLVKLDCEGSEYDIIAGLDKDLLNRVRRIVMEFHGPAMPHLTHLDPADFGPMVAKLAQEGRVRTFGRPSHGGLLWWERY